MTMIRHGLLAIAITAGLSQPVQADENLFGYVSGAETLPEGVKEGYVWLTHRTGKEVGNYSAYDVEAELEYGFTSRFQGTVSLKGQAIDTRGIRIDAYIPADEDYGMKPSGVEAKLKYKFFSPVLNSVGMATQVSVEHNWLDPHSGQDKDTFSVALDLLLQKLFMDDQLIGVANFGLESTYADRAPIANLPAGFEWPTDPEMELELTGGAGLSYRIAPRWFVGVETFYQTEFETEVGQERWSWHAGPSVHYADKKWWATLTYLKQLRGGGEMYPGQTDTDLHLIEKTGQEVRFKLGYNF